MLTPKEIQIARETFYSFDLDKNGTVSEEEIRSTFRHWFTFLHQKKYTSLKQFIAYSSKISIIFF